MSGLVDLTEEILQDSNSKAETDASGKDIKYYIYSFDIDPALKKAGEEKFAAAGMTLEEGIVSYLPILSSVNSHIYRLFSCTSFVQATGYGEPPRI